MCSYKIIAVTNRNLCSDDFLTRMERIAQAKPSAIMLREKDLSPAEYRELAGDIMKLCSSNHVPFIAHTFLGEAEILGCKNIHLPLPILRKYAGDLKDFKDVGTSVHSVEEAEAARRLGATWLMAGHVYATDCKKDLAPRGLSFLKSVCRSVQIPVYAIGGISPENVKETLSAGVQGICIMSSLMKCEDPQSYLAGMISSQ